jgi:uncharacterized protein (DUF1800 family)
MNRRSFFTGWRSTELGDSYTPATSARAASNNLDPFIPSASQPWNPIRAGHLLRRATFHPRWSDLTALLAMTPSDAVDLLLDTSYTPDPPSCADHVTESLEGLDITYQGIVRGEWEADADTLRKWQVNVMLASGLTLAEKMTAFWSNHFATEFKVDLDYVVAPLLYRQNKLFRDAGLGNFRDLMKSITLDGAMLVYLGGNLNNVGKPNENYAREMLELFTTGLGEYTEGDIHNAARILTGWRVGQFNNEPAPNGFFNAYFIPSAHDTDAKEFMGVSFPARDAASNTEFLVRRDEINRLIDTIFQQRPQAIAKFICRKLYRFFVYSAPADSDEMVVAAMADVFIQNDFAIRPVVAALLKSAHFFDNANIGGQIKTPEEFAIGIGRQIGGTPGPSDIDAMGQTLFDPPNVSGWPGWHDWITTTTYPVRASFAARLIAGVADNDLVDFIKSFPNYSDAPTLVESVAALLLPRAMSPERKAILQNKLLAGAMVYEWSDIVSNSPSTAARNLREMLTTIAELPDFQLC